MSPTKYKVNVSTENKDANLGTQVKLKRKQSTYMIKLRLFTTIPLTF